MDDEVALMLQFGDLEHPTLGVAVVLEQIRE
jgi:hypothetical protein